MRIYLSAARLFFAASFCFFAASFLLALSVLVCYTEDYAARERSAAKNSK